MYKYLVLLSTFMLEISLNDLVQAAARGDGEPFTIWDMTHPDHKMNKIFELCDHDYIPSPTVLPPVRVYIAPDGTIYLKDGYHRVAFFAYMAWEHASPYHEMPVEVVSEDFRADD